MNTLLTRSNLYSPPGKPYTSHRLLLGTHTSGQGKEYLQIATLQLPKSDTESFDRDVLSREQYDDEKGGMYGFLTTSLFPRRVSWFSHLQFNPSTHRDRLAQ